MTKLGATTHPLHPKFIPIRNIHREKSSGSSRMMLYQFHPLLGKASSNPGGGERVNQPTILSNFGDKDPSGEASWCELQLVGG